MMCSQEPVHFQFPPVLEDAFNTSEIHELLAVFQSDFPTHSTSSSETTRSVYSVEERKRRRMISNRESARRSRWRKKKQLEELTNHVNRLKLENQELKTQLCLVTNEYHLVHRETEQLLAESINLQQRLACLCQILVATQLQ